MAANPQNQVFFGFRQHGAETTSKLSETVNKMGSKLKSAADSKNWTCVDDLLTASDVTRCDIEQNCLLHRLASAPEVSLSLARDIITKIFKHEVDINMVDTNKDTAVELAARCDNTKMVMELLSRQAALPPDVTHVCSFLQTLTNNWKPQETPYMHALVVKLLWDRLKDTALHSCHTQLHHTLVRLAVTFHTSLVRHMFVTQQQVNAVDSEGMAVLHRVAMFDTDDHVRVVLFLIIKGADVNLQSTTGDTPLHVAVKHNNWKMMEALLHRRANSDVIDCEQCSVLHIAASYTNPEYFSKLNHLLPLLIRNSNDINKRDREGNTALHLAALAGNMSFMKTLLDHGARADGVNDEQKTVLHMMAMTKNELFLNIDSCRKVLSLTLKKGADVYRTDCYGNFAVHLAAEHSNWDFVEFLLRYFGDLSHLDSEGFNILHRFAIEPSLEDLHLFYHISQKIGDINARSRTGDAAIHLAAKYRNWEIVEMLVQEGALIDELDSEGFLVGHRIALGGNTESSHFSLLMEYDLNSRSLAGDTVLQLAAKHDNWSMVERLVEYVGNIDQEDSEGLTPIQRLVMSKKGKLDTSIFCRLLELCADFTCRDANNDTVLHLAARNGHWDVVRQLVELGERTNMPDSEGFVILHRLAAAKTYVLYKRDMFLSILKQNPDLHKRTSHGDTAVHLAAKYEQWDSVETLTEHGANIFDYDSENTSVLQRMIRCQFSTGKDISILQNSVKTCITIQLRESFDSLLCEAVKFCKPKIVQFFLDQRVSIPPHDSEGFSLLHNIVKTRHHTISDFKYFLDKSIDLEDSCPNGNTPLHLAAKCENWDAVKYLLLQGASIQRPDSDGVFVLQRLAMYSDYRERQQEILRILIKNGADVKIRDRNGESVLHLGARANNWCFVRQIIEHTDDLDIDELDSDGYNLLHRLAQWKDCNILHRLAQSGHSDVVESFLEKGCNVDALSRDGDTCLLLAAKRDDWDFVKRVLGHMFNRKHSSGLVVQGLSSAAKASPSFTPDVGSMSQTALDTRDPRGYTVWHLAVIRKQWDVLRQLAKCGAKMDIIDNEGLGLLHRMVSVVSDIFSTPQDAYYWNRLLDLLKENRFIFTEKDGLGNTPFQAALKNKNIMVVRFIDYVKDFHSTDSDGLSPLHRILHILPYNDSWELLQVVEEILKSCAESEEMSWDGNTSLHLAAKYSDWSTASLLLKYGARAHVCDSEGLAVLHRFAQRSYAWKNQFLKDTPFIQELLQSGANVNQKDLKGNTPLQLAVQCQNWDVANKLVQLGAEVNELDSEGYTILQRLAQVQDPGKDELRVLFTQSLLEKGARCDIPSKHGETTFDIVVENDNWNMMKYLLTHEMISVRQDDDTSLLHHFVFSCYGVLHTDVFALINESVSVNAKYCEGIETVAKNKNWKKMNFLDTHEMVSYRQHEDKSFFDRLAFSCNGALHTDVCDLLIEKGLSVNVEDCEGNTPLHVAARIGNWDLVDHLITKGGSGKKSDGNGFSILHRFVCGENKKMHLDTLGVIISSGVDVNARDPQGNTAIHIAAKRKLVDIVNRLIDIVDDLNTRDSDGLTVLLRLAQTRDSECFPVYHRLVQKGADINLCSIQGESSLTLAVKSNNWPVVEFLVSSGVQYNVQILEQLHIMQRLIKCSSSTFSEDSQIKLMTLLTITGVSLNFLDQCKKTPAELAFIHKKWKLLKHLLESKAEINNTHRKRNSFFHDLAKDYTVGNISRDITRLLTMSGLDINQQNIFGETPVNVAADKQNWDIVKIFVEHGADTNTLDRKGHSLLHKLFDNFTLIFSRLTNTCTSLVDLLTCLVQHGADINRRRPDNKTALQIAADRDDWETVGALIQLGAVCEFTPGEKQSAFNNLYRFIWTDNDEEKLKLFVNYITNDIFRVKCYFQEEEGYCGNTNVLVMCVNKSNWTMAKALVERGVDVFEPYTHQSLLEIMMSAYSESNPTAWMSFLDLMISRGLDINTKFRNGSGILFHDESITCEEEATNCLFYSLLERGANPLLVDSRGWTLLRNVVDFEREETLNALKKLLPAGVTTHQPRFTEDVLQSQRVSAARTASPTEKMIRDRNICVLKMLIESGASSNAELFRLNTRYQVLLARMAETDDNVRELLEVLNMAASQPRSLQSLSRLTVSHCLGCGPGRTDKLNRLPIPPVIRELVSFEDLLSDDFLEEDSSSSSSY